MATVRFVVNGYDCEVEATPEQSLGELANEAFRRTRHTYRLDEYELCDVHGNLLSRELLAADLRSVTNSVCLYLTLPTGKGAAA